MWPCIGLGAVGGAGRSSLHYDYITGAAGQPATLRLGLPAPGRLLPGNKINQFLVLIGLKRGWFTGCDPGGELPPAAGAAEQEILVGNSLRHPARPLLLLPGSDKNIYFCFFFFRISCTCLQSFYRTDSFIPAVFFQQRSSGNLSKANI